MTLLKFLIILLQLHDKNPHIGISGSYFSMLKMNFLFYFLIIMAGIHGGKRTNDYYVNLSRSIFALRMGHRTALTRGIMFTRLT